jgi:hypothetical protein
MALYSQGTGRGYLAINYPCAVHFAGFKSDTLRLQNNGWQISAEENLLEGRCQLGIRNSRTGLVLLAVEVKFNGAFLDSLYRGVDRHDRQEPPEFNITHVITDYLKVTMVPESIVSMRPVDARPSKTEIRCIEDFKLFSPLVDKTKEIIIEPQNVMECLELIKKMQAPDLAKIRERNRNQEMRMESIQAQILTTLAA